MRGYKWAITRRIETNKIKMAAVLNRIGLRNSTSSSLLIRHLKTISPCRKLSLSNTSFFSTESAPTSAEEFSLRHLEGKHEGTGIIELLMGEKLNYKMVQKGYYGRLLTIISWAP